ncbi:MAG: carboxypeptidase-like regulatory domain-containing protein [Lewinellaceae bacterium]|nr:carboxypeptidase-like regulatory domain-containing protein [Lewinellaceae bacterium]
MRIILSCISILMVLALPIRAQSLLQGHVQNAEGEPLAFVTVAVEAATQTGVFTDIEGRFKLAVPADARAIQFRYLGYRSIYLKPEEWENQTMLSIVMTPDSFALPEAVVRAGENPADILMRKVIARREANNPEKKAGYRCLTYNKISFDLLPNRGAFEKVMGKRDSTSKSAMESMESFNRMEESSQQHHAFLMESVTERLFRNPNLVQEKVLLNRVSGTEYAGLVALANAVQPFTFYGDYLQITDKDFVNPISPGSPALYFFTLEDTLFQGKDTIWTVSFHPRKGKVFTALEGSLQIHSNGYAVQSVRAWPVDAGNLDIKIEQSYQLLAAGNSDGDSTAQWFPQQLNFELAFRKYPSEYLGIKAAGRSYISSAAMGASSRLQDFDPEKPLLMLENANTRADSAWQSWRITAPLSEKEQRTYSWLDSLGEKKNLSRFFYLMDYVSTGLIPLAGPLNADLGRLLRFSEFENVRLGIGLSTAQPRPLAMSRRFEASLYGGYGFRDQAWKYGAETLWRINRGMQTFWSAGWRSDLEEPGILKTLPGQLVDRYVYARKVDKIQEAWTRIGTRLGKSFFLQGEFSRQNRTPLYPYIYVGGSEIQSGTFRFAEATVFLRYARHEEVHRFLGSNSGSVQHWPVLEVAYTRGLPNILGSTYSYYRWSAALYQSVFIRRLGRCSWRLEAGQASPDVPLSRLFTLNQSAGNNAFGLFAISNTFQSLPDTLFASDRFVNLYFSQEIGPVLYKHKYSAPYLSLHQNTVWGSLQQPEQHNGTGLRTADQLLCESGIRLDNLLRINYVNFARLGLGGAVYYRWGGLSEPRWQDNLLFRLSLRFEI